MEHEIIYRVALSVRCKQCGCSSLWYLYIRDLPEKKSRIILKCSRCEKEAGTGLYLTKDAHRKKVQDKIALQIWSKGKKEIE